MSCLEHWVQASEAEGVKFDGFRYCASPGQADRGSGDYSKKAPSLGEDF